MKDFLDKLFLKNKVSFTVTNLQLVNVLPYTGKSSLYLRARLRRTIEKIYHSVSLMLFLDSLADLVTCINLKIPSRKISCLQ